MAGTLTLEDMAAIATQLGPRVTKLEDDLAALTARPQDALGSTNNLFINGEGKVESTATGGLSKEEIEALIKEKVAAGPYHAVPLIAGKAKTHGAPFFTFAVREEGLLIEGSTLRIARFRGGFEMQAEGAEPGEELLIGTLPVGLELEPGGTIKLTGATPRRDAPAIGIPNPGSAVTITINEAGEMFVEAGNKGRDVFGDDVNYAIV